MEGVVLLVELLEARDLSANDPLGGCNPYALLQIGPHEVRSGRLNVCVYTSTRPTTEEPVPLRRSYLPARRPVGLPSPPPAHRVGVLASEHLSQHPSVVHVSAIIGVVVCSLAMLVSLRFRRLIA